MMQIRIYYESIEQGANYIKPIIDSVAQGKADVVLVRRPKSTSDVNTGAISALLTMTTPDGLITGIYNGVEYPLILIEFTEAVTTEDHELQRTYGAIAAHLANMYYLKIAGDKQSEKEFGGATYNPYSTPKIFNEKVGYRGYIIAEWKTQKGNTYTLERNEKYPSCPPNIDILTDTIQCSVSAFLSNPTSWYNTSFSLLSRKDSYKVFWEKVCKATGINELLSTWSNRRDSNLNKLRYFVRESWIGAKINRFSHAMDPDRGIVTFISFLFSESKSVYGIYALVRPRGNAIMKQDMTSLSLMCEKLDVALEMDGVGIPQWLKNEIKKVALNAKSMNDEVDFQPVWDAHKKQIRESKVVMTLAYFLDGMYLNHNGILLKWDKRKLVNCQDSNFIPAFAKQFHFSEYAAPTRLTPVRGIVDEDEVTYAIVHKVLIPNGFSIVSVSYPGSQGGGAILPEPELGKAQPRDYPDIIAIPPKGSKIDVVLDESKGMFSENAISKDVSKMLLYKSDPSHINALKETLVVARVFDPNRQLRDIVVGVSFGVANGRVTTWRPSDVDFIFRVVDRQRWQIGVFRQEMRDLIRIVEGNTDYPKVYMCSKDNGTLF